MQNAEMCNFMQTSVDRIGSQVYTVSHGRQITPTKDSRKGYRTMNAVCFGMMMCMCMMRKRPVPAFLCANYSA